MKKKHIGADKHRRLLFGGDGCTHVYDLYEYAFRSTSK